MGLQGATITIVRQGRSQNFSLGEGRAYLKNRDQMNNVGKIGYASSEETMVLAGTAEQLGDWGAHQ